MAKVKLNPLFESVSGAIGDMVLKHYGNRTVMTRRPVFRNRVFSEAQKATHERFREAAIWARQMMSDPRVRETYEDEARKKCKPILSLMISDYLNGPSDHDMVNGATAGRQESGLSGREHSFR